MTREQRLEELATLVGVWRSAKCSSPAVYRGAREETCDVDNHVEGCPTKNALDDVIAAHNALGAPGMARTGEGERNG